MHLHAELDHTVSANPNSETGVPTVYRHIARRHRAATLRRMVALGTITFTSTTATTTANPIQ